MGANLGAQPAAEPLISPPALFLLALMLLFDGLAMTRQLRGRTACVP